MQKYIIFCQYLDKNKTMCYTIHVVCNRIVIFWLIPSFSDYKMVQKIRQLFWRHKYIIQDDSPQIGKGVKRQVFRSDKKENQR